MKLPYSATSILLCLLLAPQRSHGFGVHKKNGDSTGKSNDQQHKRSSFLQHTSCDDSSMLPESSSVSSSRMTSTACTEQGSTPAAATSTSKECPFHKANNFVVEFQKKHSTRSAAAVTAVLTAMAVSSSTSTEMDPSWLAATAAGVLGTLALGFETVKTFEGPSLQDMPKLLWTIQTKGFLTLLKDLKQDYGDVFSIGPATIVTGNAQNVKSTFVNTKLPTVLLGLPRNVGMGSNNPHVVLEGRKALMDTAVHKQPSRELLERIAPKVQDIMKQAVAGTSDAETPNLHFRYCISKPIAGLVNREFIFGVSQAKDPVVCDQMAQQLQHQGFEITKYFGANGILTTLFRPWRLAGALDSTKQFLDGLDKALASQDIPSRCPMSQIQHSLQDGKIAKTDALQFSSSFIYTGAESIEVIAESVLWLLSHPDRQALQPQLRKEVDAVLGGPNRVITTADQLEKCHLVRATVAEALRCYEFAMPLSAMRDFDLQGKTLKKGSFVLLTDFNNLETSTKVGREEWAKSPASTFDPTVWLDEDGHFDEVLFRKFSFFGKGQHKCPGRQLGMDTVVAILATTLSHYDNLGYAGGEDASNVPLEHVSQFRRNIDFCGTKRRG